MAKFKAGDPVRPKSGGPKMTVDAYSPDGGVICTSFIKDKRHQERFVEATLELVPHDPGLAWSNPRPPRF